MTSQSQGVTGGSKVHIFSRSSGMGCRLEKRGRGSPSRREGTPSFEKHLAESMLSTWMNRNMRKGKK